MTWQEKKDQDRNPGKHHLTVKNGVVEIHVLNCHLLYPDQWILSCAVLGLDKRVMGIAFDTPIEEVKKEAVRICQNLADAISYDLNSL